MKIPRPHINVSPATRQRLTKAYALFSAIMIRFIPVIVFGLLAAQIAVWVDQKHYREAPASDFLQYTDFSVQNARENEDVYFKVCRQRVSDIRYSGDLNIYIIANADKNDESKIKVYGRNLAGTIRNECENKVIRASDFKHAVGTYEMGFCVNFNVKYGYEKQVCRVSNRYRIYAQPSDLESKIRDLELQLENAKQQQKDSSSNINAGQTGTGVQPPTCVGSILGIGIVCGSDGIIRL